MLDAPAEEMREKAQILADLIASTVGDKLEGIDVVPEISRAGGGALPMRDIPTFAVQLSFKQGSAQGCEEHLVRKNPVPIVARIKQETLLLDVRTILGPDENIEIARALAAYFDNLNASA